MKSLFHGSVVSTNRILYTPSEFAKQNLIHLQEIGSLEAKKEHTSKRENLSSYLFFIVKSGSGLLEYDGKLYRLKTGDCVFLDCKKVYFHRTSKNLWTLSWAHFFGPHMRNVYEKYRERGGSVCFHSSNYEEYKRILENIYKICSSQDYIKDMKIYEQLVALLTLLMEDSWQPERRKRLSKKRQHIQDIKDYLDQHYTEKIRLEELASIFFINKYYLARIFKDEYGTTIQNYLLQIRITQAKQLLRFTNQPIEQIGQSCGIGDGNYFSRMFKKVEGVSPGEFRKVW